MKVLNFSLLIAMFSGLITTSAFSVSKPICAKNAFGELGWQYTNSYGEDRFDIDSCDESGHFLACEDVGSWKEGWYVIREYDRPMESMTCDSEVGISIIKKKPDHFFCGNDRIVVQRIREKDLVVSGPCVDNEEDQPTVDYTTRGLYSCPVTRSTSLKISMQWTRGDHEAPDLLLEEVGMVAVGGHARVLIDLPSLQFYGNNFVAQFTYANQGIGKISVVEEWSQGLDGIPYVAYNAYLQNIDIKDFPVYLTSQPKLSCSKLF